MRVINSIMSWIMKKRIHQMELFMKYPEEVQQENLKRIIGQSKDTVFGNKYQFSSMGRVREFQERVPVVNYEGLYPYIERTLKGEPNVLWPTEIRWFAKSSGTTNARSKFIPVTQEALEDCHFKGGKDMLALYCQSSENTQLFSGKNLSLGGSHQQNHWNPDTFYGDLSAVIMQNLPFWAQFIRTPDLSIALMEDWESKIVKIGENTIIENVISVSGVPTWMMVLFHWVMQRKGVQDVREVWPNFEVLFHGGVGFGPYRDSIKSIFGGNMPKTVEIYNASEGFFGIQDDPNKNEMLLMLDYGIFYEFVPLSELGQPFPSTKTIGEVEVGKAYAVVISTNGGLWRYLIGDTVRFTSTFPHRFVIVGRTKLFINVFGEELMIENADFAIEKACLMTHSVMADYTAGPVYMKDGKGGGHEWIIAFEKHPKNLNEFAAALDEQLQLVNSDYAAKRKENMGMNPPLVHAASADTFYNWLKEKGKLGGQHKVPRLCNDREILEAILPKINILE
jgi:hypothetical protein